MLRAKPDFARISVPSGPALTVPAVTDSIPCANEAVVLVTIPVVTVTEFSRNVPLVRGANALSTVARTLPRAQYAIC